MSSQSTARAPTLPWPVRAPPGSCARAIGKRGRNPRPLFPIARTRTRSTSTPRFFNRARLTPGPGPGPELTSRFVLQAHRGPPRLQHHWPAAGQLAGVAVHLLVPVAVRARAQGTARRPPPPTPHATRHVPRSGYLAACPTVSPRYRFTAHLFPSLLFPSSGVARPSSHRARAPPRHGEPLISRCWLSIRVLVEQSV